MTHLVDKQHLGKAGSLMTESVVLGGFVVCAIAAVLYDIWHVIAE